MAFFSLSTSITVGSGPVTFSTSYSSSTPNSVSYSYSTHGYPQSRAQSQQQQQFHALPPANSAHSHHSSSSLPSSHMQFSHSHLPMQQQYLQVESDDGDNGNASAESQSQYINGQMQPNAQRLPPQFTQSSSSSPSSVNQSHSHSHAYHPHTHSRAQAHLPSSSASSSATYSNFQSPAYSRMQQRNFIDLTGDSSANGNAHVYHPILQQQAMRPLLPNLRVNAAATDSSTHLNSASIELVDDEDSKDSYSMQQPHPAMTAMRPHARRGVYPSAFDAEFVDESSASGESDAVQEIGGEDDEEVEELPSLETQPVEDPRTQHLRSMLAQQSRQLQEIQANHQQHLQRVHQSQQQAVSPITNFIPMSQPNFHPAQSTFIATSAPMGGFSAQVSSSSGMPLSVSLRVPQHPMQQTMDASLQQLEVQMRMRHNHHNHIHSHNHHQHHHQHQHHHHHPAAAAAAALQHSLFNYPLHQLAQSLQSEYMRATFESMYNDPTHNSDHPASEKVIALLKEEVIIAKKTKKQRINKDDQNSSSEESMNDDDEEEEEEEEDEDENEGNTAASPTEATGKTETNTSPAQLSSLLPSCETLACSVCQCDFELGEKGVRFPCMGEHPFHLNCLLPWLHQKNTCPSCRYPLETDDEKYNEEVVYKQRELRATATAKNSNNTDNNGAQARQHSSDQSPTLNSFDGGSGLNSGSYNASLAAANNRDGSNSGGTNGNPPTRRMESNNISTASSHLHSQSQAHVRNNGQLYPNTSVTASSRHGDNLGSSSSSAPHGHARVSAHQMPVPTAVFAFNPQPNQSSSSSFSSSSSSATAGQYSQSQAQTHFPQQTQARPLQSQPYSQFHANAAQYAQQSQGYSQVPSLRISLPANANVHRGFPMHQQLQQQQQQQWQSQQFGSHAQSSSQRHFPPHHHNPPHQSSAATAARYSDDQESHAVHVYDGDGGYEVDDEEESRLQPTFYPAQQQPQYAQVPPTAALSHNDVYNAVNYYHTRR